MTKGDLVDSMCDKVAGVTKKQAAEIVEAVFVAMKETLQRGEKIKIAGFGSFEVRDKNARKGRNPKTGAEIEIAARRVLSFKTSQRLKDSLNS